MAAKGDYRSLATQVDGEKVVVCGRRLRAAVSLRWLPDHARPHFDAK
jgi:hypothetical protein